MMNMMITMVMVMNMMTVMMTFDKDLVLDISNFKYSIRYESILNKDMKATTYRYESYYIQI